LCWYIFIRCSREKFCGAEAPIISSKAGSPELVFFDTEDVLAAAAAAAETEEPVAMKGVIGVRKNGEVKEAAEEAEGPCPEGVAIPKALLRFDGKKGDC
jgi:hypothetical protein